MAEKISIVIVSIAASEITSRCLDALSRQVDFLTVDVQLFGKWDPGARGVGELQKRFPEINWVQAPDSLSIPEMRWLGVQQSTGSFVVLLEDDCMVTENWFRVLNDSLAAPFTAMGGSIEPQKYARLLDWAVFFCDYAPFLPPLKQRGRLAGNHVVYHRAELITHIEKSELETGRGIYDVFLHDELVQAGGILRNNSGWTVQNINTWEFSHVTKIPFRFASDYAQKRSQKFSQIVRLQYAVGAFLLPILLTARTVRDVFSRKQYRSKLFKSLGWILIYQSSWAVGEFAGYATRYKPGDSGWK